MSELKPQPANFATHFGCNGVAIIEYVFTASEMTALDAAFETYSPSGAGARQARLGQNFVASLRRNQTLQGIADQLSGGIAQLVRVVTFDKTPETNWFVPWHQDRSVALDQRLDVPEFEAWTVKDGCHHAEPPISLLEAMVTLRLHLDDCDEDSGPLEVVPGSHRFGRLDRNGVEKAVRNGTPQLCLAARGDVLVMRPLIVHRSQRAKKPSARRVIHLEYATMSLPAPLMWALT
jgi:Phytanoyl-CoA dioxygenase (PhyH)